MSSQVGEWQHQVGFLSWELFPRSYICLVISVELSKCMHAVLCSAVPDSLRAVLFWGELEIWEEIRTWFWNQKCAEVLLLIVHKPACLFWAIWKLFSLFSLLAIFYFFPYRPVCLNFFCFEAAVNGCWGNFWISGDPWNPVSSVTRFSALKPHPPGLEKLPSGDEDKQI